METAVSRLLVLSLHLSLFSYGSTAAVHSLHRRGVVLLCYQMEKAVNSTCFDYLGYGCYCGLGGHGTPLDEVDKCCQVHDQCYGEAKCKRGWYDYIVHYSLKCSGDKCNCTDTESTYPCAYTICECDRVFAECLKSTKHLVNPDYKDYNKKKCDPQPRNEKHRAIG